MGRNIAAVVVGIVVCMFMNGGLIGVGGKIIPLPEGLDPHDLESFKKNAHLLQAKHFIMPFLAHALGSVLGAWVAALIASSRKMTFAMVIGCVHLLGGIAAAFMIPTPVWFIALDLGVAYIPAAWVGGKLGGGSKTALQNT